MNKNKLVKRTLAIVLSAAMVFTNIGHSPTVAYAASGNSVDFMVSGTDFVAAIEDMIHSGAEPLKQEELDFTNGKAEKYYQFFFDGEDPVYEFYPEFDGQDMEAEVRVFVRLPEAADDTYSLTGEEEIIFLYINNSEDTISCSTTILMSDGSEKRTKRVTVKDYETAFGDNRIEYKSNTSATGQTEAEIPESDAAEIEKPGTDAPMVETPETSMEESGVTEPETGSGIPDQETEEKENEAVETDEVIEDTKPEIVEKSEPETQSPDVSEEGKTQADSPVASRIRHAVPVVAAVDTGEENSTIEPSVDKQQEDTETSGTHDDSEKHSNDKDNETVGSVPKESSAEAESETESLTEESGKQTEAPADETGEETTAVESSEPATDIQTPSEESRTETSEETQTETSEETQPVESEPVQVTETQESQISTETESIPVSSIGNGDLVGMDGCSTAKAYVTTLKKLKVLDEVDGYRVTYEITPEDKAAIVDKCDRVKAGESVTFGVEEQEGFRVGQVEANGDVVESAYSEENIVWFTLEYVEEDLEILITMVPDGTSMPFNKTISMDDGMDITISALPGVLPENTEVTAEIVTSQVEEAIRSDQSEEGREIIAAPAYDINLCLDGEKLDDEIWNRNGAVTVSFSGPLMDQLIQESQMAQVLWVKDENNSTEVMEGSYKDITREGTTEDLSFETSHFTTFAAVFAVAPDISNVFNIDEHGLMDEDFPKLVVRDKDENTLDIEITEQEDGARRVTLKDGKPLPRNISTWFEISYDFKNSSDPFFETYSVQKGDHFTYQFPSNILYDKKQTVVKDINGGEAVIGTASINAEGYMDVEITAENVGQNYRGTAEAGGKLDLEKVLEEKNEITLVGDEVEYIMELVPAPVQENYSVKVVKGPKSGKWTDQDIRYDENRLPSALQYHVTVTADAQNSGPITNVEVSDTLGNTKNGTIVFDKTQEIKFESNNQDTVIDNVTFGGMSNGGKTIGIQLNTKDGMPASMMPGESVSLSYWVKLGAGAWSGQNTGNSSKEMSASLFLELKNTVNVTADKKVSGSDSTTFKRTIECVTKSGIVHYNYEIDGKTEPVVIEYHVFVNPRLINMTGWTIEDKLDKNQKYLGNVEVIAYTGKNGTSLGKVDDIEPIISKNPQTWKYVIENPGKYYYDFKYFTTPNEATESNLSNEIKITWPGGGSGGIGGSTGVGFLYNTYTMTKKNLSSNMKSSNNINSGGVYEPVNNTAGNVGWGDEFGTIRWQSVLTPYADGQTKGATIPAGTVYKDSLSVIKWGNKNKEDAARANMHTFKDDGSFKASFVLKDGNGRAISPDDGTYTLSFDEKLGNRGFSVVFSKDVPGPVVIEYESFVDLEMLENVGVFDKDGTKDNLRFKNVGEMTINGTTWKSATSQPYYIEDYISKNWVKNDTKAGTITWNLNINKGYGNDAPQNLGRFTVDVIEYIPEGLTLDHIKFQSMNYTLKPEKGDYDIDGNKVTIHLNTVARNFSGYKMSKHINLNIITKVTDPSIKSFTNSAQMVIDGNMLHKVSATTGFDKSFLKKGMAYSRDTAPYAEYTILVNQPGADISNGTLTVIDTLGVPGKMAYVPDSFKVTNAENGTPIEEANIRVGKDSFGNDSFEISNLPNKTPIKIFYKVMITGAINETVDTKNTASLLYSREGIITETIERSVTIVKAAFTGGGKFSIKLYKVDQNKQPLTGAAFTLSKVSEVGSPDLEYVGEFTPVIDSGNPQAGAAVLITGLEKGQLYYLEETTVPEGYQKAEGEYFIIPDRENGIGVPDGAIAIENAGTPHVVENIKNSGTLKLTKDVNGRESGSDFETDFYFTVYGGDRYYDRDGSYADLRTVKLHYDSRIADNSLILSLPIGEYVVKEVADAEGTPINGDNFYYNVQINGEDRNEAVIAIEKEQQAECLVKNLYEADGNPQFTAMKTMEGRPLEEGEFTFRIYEGDTLKAEAQNGLNGVILFPEINYKANDAGRHTYTIMEQKGTLTGVDYDDTVYTVTVEVTDNHDRTVSAEIVNIQRSDGAEAEVIQFNNVYHENPETTPDPSPNPNPNPSPSPGGSTGGGGGTSNTGGGRYQPSDGGPGVTISITPEEVPMAQIPSQPDSLITILDDDVPLAPLPKTGDMSVDHYMLTVISMLLTGIYLALTKRKKE